MQEAHGGIEPARRLWQRRTRHHERTFRVEVPRKRCPEHARQQFIAFQWSDGESALPGTPTRPAHTCRSVSPVHSVNDIRRRYIPFCQMLETGRRENQRPVNPGARHT
jgi:hypothetical protein